MEEAGPDQEGLRDFILGGQRWSSGQPGALVQEDPTVGEDQGTLEVVVPFLGKEKCSRGGTDTQTRSPVNRLVRLTRSSLSLI